MNSQGLPATQKALTYFAKWHIASAGHFAKLSAEAEASYQSKMDAGEVFGDDEFNHFLTQKRAYVTATIFSAVAYLEATINEFLADVIHESKVSAVQQLDPAIKKQIKNLCLLEIQPPNATKPTKIHNFLERLSILEKYNLILSLLPQKPLFNTGCFPYQDVNNLIEFRNYLVHFKPEWFGGYGGSGEDNRFLDSLASKFKSPLFPNNPAFDRCLCSECAQWAVETTQEFVRSFSEKISKSK